MKPQDHKAALRTALRARLRSASEAERTVGSVRVMAILRDRLEWTAARVVLLYSPMPDELDLAPMFREALGARKILALPRFVAATGEYEACRVREPDRDLIAGRYGILEPRSDLPSIPLNQLDLAMVPGLGYSLNGVRLGRGKGYYDRLLAQVPGCKCGVGYDWQVGWEVPAESHDTQLDCILTPTRWLDRRSGD